MISVKKSSVLPFFILALLLAQAFVPSATHGQSLEDAIELYRDGEVEQALEEFIRLENDEMAILYAGKSWMDLGEYLKAGYYLRRAVESETAAVSSEALFSLALNEFRLKNHAEALQILNDLSRETGRTGTASQARQLYIQILEYLTDGQRFEVFWQNHDPGIRLDLVRSAVGRSDPSMLRSMLLELEKLAELTDDPSLLNNLRDRIESSGATSSTTFRSQPVPEGTVYPIGVALPSFETTEPEFEVSRNLYFGMMLAAEEFNARNADRKLFLRFRDTHSSPDSVRNVMNELVWNEHADVVVGPLFSEAAEVMSQMAETYEIPMITPLANSDRINSGHNYTFQLNPTLAMHGREMARFAVSELNLNSFAVIVEQGSPGQSSANAFRREAEKLGAEIIYHMEEDFASLGYDISHVTEHFTTDSILVDSLGYKPVDGIYAPFTGQAAATLVNLLMTDLEAMGSDVVVLGSEVWGSARYTPAQRNNFAIYHTRPHAPGEENEASRYFEEDYTTRFGLPPDEFSRIGYDTAAWLFNNLERAGNPEQLKEALRSAPPYKGLILNIHFGDSQVNSQVKVLPLTEKAQRLGGT